MQHSDPTVNVSSLFIRSANIRICESTYRLFAFFFFLDLRLALGLVARLSFMLKYQLYNMTEICAYSQYGGGNSFCVCVWVLAVEELASEYWWEQGTRPCAAHG